MTYKTNGYVCIEKLTITVDNEELQFQPGDQVPSHIIAGFPRATREKYFVRNPYLRGDVKAH